MQYKFKLILIVFLLLASTGCTSIIRFSDKSTERKEEVKQKNTSTKKKTLPVDETSDKTNTEILYKNDIQKMILEEAESWIGTPYRYGGTDKKGVDCSGLTYNVYLSIGINLPRTAEHQYNFTKRMSISELEVGDLIFFANRGKISHVGIYIGGNTMIHASTSSGVIRQSLDSYSGMTIAGYGRP